MKLVEEALKPITGYLISITRDTINGWYEFEIGLPAEWVFVNNDDINCEIINETDEGKLMKISPLNPNIGIDDLIIYVETIIVTNQKIADKEKEFETKMKEMKLHLEDEARKFYEELDSLKEVSFKNLSENKKEIKTKKKHIPFITGSTNVVNINSNTEIVSE